MVANEFFNDSIQREKAEIVGHVMDVLKSNAVGILNAKKAKDIILLLKARGIKMIPQTLRAIMWDIRNQELINGVCATPHIGYWIATDSDEIEDTVNSLRSRIVSQLQTYRSIKKQWYRMKLKEQHKNGIVNIKPDSDQAIQPGSSKSL